MKKFYLLMIATLLMATTYAQEPIFEKGNTAINIGVGLGLRGLPLDLSVTYGIVDNLFTAKGLTLGVGGYLGFSSWKSSSFWGYGGHTFFPGAKVEVHYSIVDKLDFFGGFLAGLRIDKWDAGYWTTPGTERSYYFSTGAYVGAKYFITPNFGFYATAGYGIAFLSGGIALQF